jgi:hypothetical protein
MPSEDQGVIVIIANRQVPVGLIAVWGLCLAALLVGHFVLVAPRGRAVADSQARIEQAVERFALLRKARSQPEQDRLAAEQQELERRLADYVFTAEQVSELDFELRRLAEKNNLREFSSRHVRTTPKVGPVQLKKIVQRDLLLSFKSTFSEFLQFVNELERHSPIVIVDTFTPSATRDSGGLLSCTLEASVLCEATAR